MSQIITKYLNMAAKGLDQETYFSLYQQSLTQPQQFWGQQATRYLQWDKPWDHVLTGDLTGHNISWFQGGYLNASVNCLDRHLPAHANQIAIIWEGDEPDQTQTLTYAEVHEQVCRFANALRGLGVKTGDRVCIYLPMIPQMAVAMLACARLGAIHSVVFAGFSAHALCNRILDANCHWVITADESIRGGKSTPLKANTDQALRECPDVRQVIVVKHTGAKVNWQSGRDVWYEEMVQAAVPYCAPVSLEATQPLFILYTSGSTGNPKGIVHALAGYLLYTTMSFQVIFNYQAGDVYWCTADAGWITGHSYLVYGPLASAATLVMFAGTPVHPSPARFWQIIDRYGVNIFYSAPTVIRTLMGLGDSFVHSTTRQSLKLLASVGEPLNPEAWRWYYEVVGANRCPVIDTWWQTETGGVMLAPLAGATPLKPGAVGRPFFGVAPKIMAPTGQVLPEQAEGALVLTQPWPGMAQTVYGDPDRFSETYFSKYPGNYFTGDGAYHDADGDYWVTGRVDDVINVSGHRLGSAEIESALVAHPKVAEAAVVSYQHSIKGEGIYAFVTVMIDVVADSMLADELRLWVREQISAIAIPDVIHFAAELPKTRSGKIMRRILRKIISQDKAGLGDTSTLANPEVVQALFNSTAFSKISVAGVTRSRQ